MTSPPAPFSPINDLEAQPEIATATSTSHQHWRSQSTSGWPASPSSQRPPSSAFRIRRTPTFIAAPNYQTKIPGEEPGLDPNEIGGDRVNLHTYCGITVVDFSGDQIVQTELDNTSLKEFLDVPRPEWVKVRWINCNGLSWDCIKALANYKNLHRLAIEDLLNTHNRTKCDWYSDHAFIILPLLKIIDGKGLGIYPEQSHKEKSQTFFQKLFKRKRTDSETGLKENFGKDFGEPEAADGTSSGQRFESEKIKTLHRYHGGPNNERIEYMEQHSSLAPQKLVVTAEQVSMFLTADGTVISFFENSADDIEPPILQRLNSERTLLRSACDASMVLQAIIDAIIDLAFPVVRAYQDTLADLELTVLTDPSVQQSQSLYILTSELSLLKSTLAPIPGLLSSLRDHKMTVTPRGKGLTGVEVSEMTKTYLGDVDDHCLLLLDGLETMKRAADNMTDLIFNTVGSLQNESMKRLTLVTILFLPMSFLTGYFGMNFTEFPGIEHSDRYFWSIAGPVALATTLFLLRDVFVRDVYKWVRKRAIKTARVKRQSGLGRRGRKG
ncbi:hypothetical protein RUND412_007213 [Rhizina undulata]